MCVYVCVCICMCVCMYVCVVVCICGGTIKFFAIYGHVGQSSFCLCSC